MKIKRSMKKLGKRPLAMLLAMVLCFTVFAGILAIQVNAAATATVYMVALPRGSADGTAWGQPALKFLNGWTFSETTSTNVISTGDYNGRTAYCIEPGIGIHTGDSMTQQNSSDYWKNYPANKALTGEQIKTMIGRVINYGWQGNNNTSWSADNNTHVNEMAELFATRLLVWECIVGERDKDFNHVDTGNSNRLTESVKSNHPFRSKIFEHYDRIVSEVKAHGKIPAGFSESSGSAKTYEMTYSNGKYTVTIPDSNNVLSNYTVTTTNSNVSVTRSGSNLIVTTDTAFTGALTVTAKKSITTQSLVVWGDGVTSATNKSQFQDIVFGEKASESITAYANVKISVGHMEIIKTSQHNNGEVSGFQFEVKSESGSKVGTYTSGADGKIRIENMPVGKYTVEEISLSENFVEPSPNPLTIEVKTGETAKFTFDNVRKRGVITVQKTNSNPTMGDYPLEGAEFTVYDASGKAVGTAATDSTGKATFDPLPLPATYTVKETQAPYGYVLNTETYTVTLSGSQGNAALVYAPVTTVPERPQTGKVTITKYDVETADTAQGDAILTGAVFDIYDKDQKTILTTLYCGNNNQATSIELPLGTYYFKERTPPTGYLLDKDFHKFELSYEGQHITVTSTSESLENTVKKGQVQLVKTAGDGETGIQAPEVGAEFQIYLLSSGSYSSAKSSERDILTVDGNGFTNLSKKLPYGLYRIHQTKGWDSQEMMEDFDVFIDEDGKVYYFILNNATKVSLIEIEKRDAETGKIIPTGGVGFKIRNKDTGEYVVQSIRYPTPMELDVFYTDVTGKLMLPEPLEYGTYQLIEQNAPYGYVLSEEPVEFTVDGTETLVTVVKYNMPQKGKLIVQKTGEVFASVQETVQEDGSVIYQPEYIVQGMPGAVYEVIANEDIYTPDGTLRNQYDEEIGRITTDKNGVAELDGLYLGKYRLREVQAPDGMVLNPDTVYFELTYAGETVEVVLHEESFYNQRQKAEILLYKDMETDERFGIGMNGEETSVSFGLYAAEDIKAADGTVIPKDRLIEVASVLDGQIRFLSDLPFGEYYTKELTTDEHYQISEEVFPLSFQYAGQETLSYVIYVNDGELIQNELVRGKITGVKVGELGEPLAGAIIGLFPEGTVDFTEETAILTYVTEDDGYFEFDGVPQGLWLIREIEAPEGYVLSGETHYIYLLEHESHFTITIENTLIRGEVKVKKVDAQHPDTLLDGAVFEVFADTNENGVLDNEDEWIGRMEETSTGVHSLTDLVYGSYFLLEIIAPEGYSADKTPYPFQIHADGKTVWVENEEGVGFTNEPLPQGELSVPETGDSVSYRMLAAIIVGSLAGGGITLTVYKKRRKKQEGK